MALILRYFAEFGSFAGQLCYVKVVDHPLTDSLPRNVAKYRKSATRHDGRAVFFAVAELLVRFSHFHLMSDHDVAWYMDIGLVWCPTDWWR